MHSIEFLTNLYYIILWIFNINDINDINDIDLLYFDDDDYNEEIYTCNSCGLTVNDIDNCTDCNYNICELCMDVEMQVCNICITNDILYDDYNDGIFV